MTDYLIDTLVWTGALLALVLLVRRPVAATFGPKAAYALWALPMARLILPPLVLPAWMAPAPEPLAFGETVIDAPLAAFEPAAYTVPAPSIVAVPAEPLVDWRILLLALWLTGAGVFLVRRYALYFRMRRELLAEARPMGEAGRVRLVETPAAGGPVAFGVIDKVIALPTGFMASHDRAARDLALAHELAHHRGGDLICNMLVQPLFAIHWFNPLSMLGWRALRRDQEAACDARVIAHQPRESRAAYAAVIARFATLPQHGGRLALAAPMACPVLGDRSIVQRLKSLGMNDLSARRRVAGRLLIGASALALPLTASVSYAQDDGPVPPSAPEAPLAPDVPHAVEAPLPPAPPSAAEGKHRIVRVERTVDKDGKVTERRYVTRGDHMTAEERAEFEHDMAEMRDDLRESARDREEWQREWKKEQIELQREMRETFGENGEVQREIRMAVAEAGRARAEAMAEAGKARAHALADAGRARADAMAVARASMAAAPRVIMRCRQGQKQVAETVMENGREHIFVCNSLATREATRAIATARAEINRTRDLSDEQRIEALRSLDEAEREVKAEARSPLSDASMVRDHGKYLVPAAFVSPRQDGDECEKDKAKRAVIAVRT